MTAAARRLASGLSCLRGRRRGAECALAGVLVGLGAWALPVPVAFGEGSVDVNAGPGTRTRQALSTAAGNYSVLRVYARAGERIQMGSSAMGVGTASTIRVFPPGTNFASATNPAVAATYPSDPVFATAALDCRTAQPGTGRMATRAQELAGPLPNTGGYVPCQYVAPADGIYPVFLAPVSLSGNGEPGTVSAPITGATQAITISIWDVTVRSAGGAVQQGRVFTHRASLRTSTAAGSASDFSAYVFTCTGFLYAIDFFGHAGLNWIMAVDDRGVIDSATGNPTLASFRYLAGVNGPVFPQARAPLMSDPDLVRDRRHPVFLHEPDPLTLSGPGGLQDTRGCSPVPVTAATTPLTDVAFTGSRGQVGGTDRGSGGTLSFNAPAILAGNGYSAALDLDASGGFGDPADVTAQGRRLGAGPNAYVWDGRDGTGATPGCGTYAYRIQTTLGDVHFTQDDVENSGGTQVERLTLATDPAFPDPRALSYNDIDPYKRTAVTNAVPTAVARGVSGPSFHRWTGNTGDFDWVDTWASLPGQAADGTFKVLCADLAIAKTAPSAAVPGEPLTYQLVVTNQGPDAASDVLVTDPLPTGLTFVSASPGCGLSGQTVSCSLGALAAGTSQTLRVTVDVPSSATGQIVNTAVVTSPTPDPIPVNNSSSSTVQSTGAVDLAIRKIASTSTTGPDAQVLYTLVIENDGPSDATGVTVVDTPPAALAAQSAEPAQGTCEIAAGRVTCALGSLAAGAATQVLITARTAADAAGALINTATVTGDQNDPEPSDNTATATLTVPSPPPPPQARSALSITKRADRDRVALGQSVTYTILVTNTGPDPATAAHMTDTASLPGELLAIEASAGTCDRALPVSCALGTIPPGGTVTIVVTFRPTDTGSLRNAASVTSENSDPATADNLTVIANRVRVALVMTKTANHRTVAAGRPVRYRIRVRNPSPQPIRKIRTCDRLPAGLVLTKSTPAARRTRGRACWTTGRLDPRRSRTYTLTARARQGTSGTQINRATATSPDAAAGHARRLVRVRSNPAPAFTG